MHMMPLLRLALVLLLALLSASTPSAAPLQVPDTMAQRAQACTGCHGPQGRSRPDGYVPRLAGKPEGYLRAQLGAFRDLRRRHEGMARLLENLDDAMLDALAHHFATLEAPYPPPLPLALGAGDARRAEELVRQGDARLGVPACVACHGELLTGIAPAVPGLVGLPDNYLMGQLGAWRNDLRRARAPDCMAAIAQRLPAEDVSRIARWLAAQPVPSGGRPSTQVPVRWPAECGSLRP